MYELYINKMRIKSRKKLASITSKYLDKHCCNKIENYEASNHIQNMNKCEVND